MTRKVSQGVSRFITISAVTLSISLGLCGITFLAAQQFSSESVIITVAFIEFGGMALGALGLVLGAILALVEVLFTGERVPHIDGNDKDPE